MTLEKGGGFFRTKGGELLPRGGGGNATPCAPLKETLVTYII